MLNCNTNTDVVTGMVFVWSCPWVWQPRVLKCQGVSNCSERDGLDGQAVFMDAAKSINECGIRLYMRSDALAS